MQRHIIKSVLLCFALSSLHAQTTKQPGTGPTNTGQTNPYWEQRRKQWDAVRNPKKDDNQKKKDEEKPSARALMEQKLRHTDQFYQDTDNLYSLPGMVVNKNGTWEGGDNLFNITENIGVAADIVAPDPSTFPVKTEDIKKRVSTILQQGGINPQAMMSGNKAPLPLLNIAIIAQPIDKGYAVYIGGHLLEDVDVRRIKAEDGSTQAITWEREHLIVSSTEELPYHINKTVEEIAYNFVKIYRFFKDLNPEPNKRPTIRINTQQQRAW